MKRTNFYFGFQSLLVLIFAAFATGASAQGAGITCKGAINITLDGTTPPTSCTYTILASDILATGTFGAVAISRDGGITFPVGNTTVGPADIGQTFKVQVTANGNKCWGFAKVEDKTGPLIKCPKDILLLCTQTPLNTTPFLSQTGDLGYADGTKFLKGIDANGNQITAANGSALDCSTIGVADERYTDFVFDAPCTTGAGPFNNPTALPAGATLTGIPAADQAAVTAQIAAIVGARTDVVRIIVRQFISTDHYGNASKPCYQIIGIRKATTVLVPRDTTFACSATGSVNVDPSVAGYTTVVDTVLIAGVKTAVKYQVTPGTATTCNIAAYYNDARIDLCPGSYKIVRSWTIINWCSGLAPITGTQVIKVLDFVEPTVSWSATNYTRVASTLCYTDLWSNDNTLTVYNKLNATPASGVFDYAVRQANTLGIPTAGPSPVGSAGPVVTTINALGSGYSCGGTVSFKFSATDVCTNAAVSLIASDSRFTITQLSSGLVGGVYTTTYQASASFATSDSVNVTFTAADACGYALAKKDFVIAITDNIAPEPVCILDTKVALTTDGKNRMSASALNSGSRDNCAVKQIFVRRMDAQQPQTIQVSGANACGGLVPDVCAGNTPRWKDYVEFGCADAGNTVVVMLGVLDYANNFNFCMVNVLVENKLIPTCVPPAALTVSCTQATTTLASLSTLGQPQIFSTCPGTIITENTATGALDVCKVGTYTRTWTLTDCKGNAFPSTLTGCSQTITFTKLSDFIVDFPDDITVDCYAGIPSKDSLQRQLMDPASFSLGKDGNVVNNGCGVLAVNVTDVIYQAVPDACQKIIRKICVIDWCKYNPNNDLVDFNSDNYGRPKLGDIHGYADASGKYYQSVSGSGAEATNLPAWQELYQVTGWFDPSTSAPYLAGFDRRFQDADSLASSAKSPNNYNVAASLYNPTNPYAFSDGIICFQQIIKVIDKTPPTSTPKDTIVCDYGTSLTQCYADYKFQIVSLDLCNGKPTAFSNGNGGQANNPLTTVWTIRDANGNAVASSTNLSGLISVSLPYGSYTVTYTVQDLCNNLAGPFKYALILKDCKAPSVVCYDTRAALMNGGTGSVGVWAREILSSVQDNCASSDQLKATATITLATANSAGTDTIRTFTCADFNAAKTIEVKVWVKDQAGNYNFCRTIVSLQDPLGVCTRPITTPLSGVIASENSQLVANATISASANGSSVNASSTTGANGAFTMSLLTGASYQARASKNDATEKYAGVTTYDIALISKHILGIELLSSAYKIIAADVDKSNEIDAADMLALRRFILNITPSLEAGIWRFVDKSYVFKNSSNPFGEDFPEVVNVTNLSTTSAANFVAVKIGDVNQSYSPAFASTVVRSAKTVTLNVEDQNLIAGNEYTVSIGAENFNAQSIQGTFQFNGATVKAVKAGNLANISDANFGVFTNAVTASWNGAATATANVAEITFVANVNGKLSDVLSIGSSKTTAVANDANGNEANVTLKFNTGKVSGGEFALYQNTPNPVENSTEIRFNLPTSAKATLSVMNVEGKVLFVKAIDGAAGINAVQINKSELGASGVLHYRLDTPEYSATKKMIIVE